MTIHHIHSKQEFDRLISFEQVIAKFAHKDCPPYIAIQADFERLAALHPEYVFVCINVTEQPEIKAEWDIKTWPTFCLFQKAQIKIKVTGAQSLVFLSEAVFNHSLAEIN